MSGIRQSSELCFLRRFSPKELSWINALFERYRGLRIFGFCADYTVAVILAFLLMSAAAVCAMGLAGEIAHARLSAQDGNSTYRNYIIDAIYNMTPEQLEEGAKYEVR